MHLFSSPQGGEVGCWCSIGCGLLLAAWQMMTLSLHTTGMSCRSDSLSGSDLPRPEGVGMKGREGVTTLRCFAAMDGFGGLGAMLGEGVGMVWPGGRSLPAHVMSTCSQESPEL